VSREDDGRALGHLVDLLDEDRAASLEVGDDVGVVDDLLAHVDAGAVALERLLDDLHRALDAGARRSRRGERDRARAGRAAPRVEHAGRRPQRAEGAYDAAGQGQGVVQLARRRVEHRAHDGQRAPGSGRRQPGGLHVHRDRAGRAQPGARRAAHEPRAAGQRPLVDGEAAATQGARDQRRGRAFDRPGRAAQLGGDDEVAGAQRRIQRAAEARNRDGLGVGGLRRGGARAPRAHAGAPQGGAVAEVGRQRARLDPQRREDEDGHAASASRGCSSGRAARTSRAAAWPLRTAPSIVAGQPVAV
jgi:hypothetical protein